MQNTGLLIDILIILLILIALGIVYYYTRRFRKPAGDEDKYLSALEYLLDGENKRAIQKFKEVVRENTEHVNAYLRLGDILRKRGLVNNALKIHRDLTLRSGLEPDFQAKVQRSLMLDYESLGEFEKAAQIAASILKTNGAYQSEMAAKLLGYYEKLRNWEAAYSTGKQHLKGTSTLWRKRIALYQVFEGVQLLEDEQGREARIKFKEALKTDPKCTPAYYYLGESYYIEERLEEAVKEWQELCRKIPEHAHVVFDPLERAWFELGKFTEAEKLYNDILTVDAENVDAALALAEIYNKKGDYDRSLDILDRVENIKPNEPKIIGYRIQTLHSKSQYKTASERALEFFAERNYLDSKKFVCQECQYHTEKPLWICPQCQSIDSFNL